MMAFVRRFLLEGFHHVPLSSSSMCWVMHPLSQKLLAVRAFVSPLLIKLLGHVF
jgi:hypothetical protein